MTEGCETLRKGTSQFVPSKEEAAAVWCAGEKPVWQNGHTERGGVLPVSLYKYQFSTYVYRNANANKLSSNLPILRRYNLREIFFKFLVTVSHRTWVDLTKLVITFFSFIISPETNELSVHKYFTFVSFSPTLAFLYSPSTNVQEKLASIRQ
jgi:hypothetical protein